MSKPGLIKKKTLRKPKISSSKEPKPTQKLNKVFTKDLTIKEPKKIYSLQITRIDLLSYLNYYSFVL